MKESRKHARERRDRGRAGQGVNAFRRSASPPLHRPQERDREGGSHRSPPPKRQLADRSNDLFPRDARQHRNRDHRSRPSHRRGEGDQGIRRVQPLELDSSRDLNIRGRHQRLEDRRSRSPSPPRGRGKVTSSPPARRQNSRSPIRSPSARNRKRQRRESSLSREPHDLLDLIDNPKPSRTSIHAGRLRSYSPDGGEPSVTHRNIKRDHRASSRSRSPTRDRTGKRSHHHSPRRYRESSRSRKEYRSSHRRPSRSPHQKPAHSKRRDQRSRSPRGRSGERRRETSRNRDHRRSRLTRSNSRGSTRHSEVGDDSWSAQDKSTATSVDINMTGRGQRGGHGSRHRAHHAFGGSGGTQDFHNHGPLAHATPNAYHSSAGSSPYGRSGWAGSPQHQQSSQYPQGNSGSQGGPYTTATFSPQHSAVPAGPMQQHPRGQSHRGGSAGSGRGNSFSPVRGSYRGMNLKSTQGPPPNSQGPGSRTPFEAASASAEPTAPLSNEDLPKNRNAFQPLKQSQEDDHTTFREDNDGNDMLPPSRQPPSGPAAQSASSSKFSFAFKASAKPAPTAPKPEISQKFNAAPQKRDAPQQQDARERDPPRGAPTEPAWSRGRQERKPQQPPTGPKAGPEHPRTRIVKQKMKRMLPRETLPVDLTCSESVYFRKPGNESVVGSGTYGKVFKGLHVYTKDLVALKRIRMEGEKDGFPVTAIREIKLLQSLRHPNIVHLKEVMVEKNDCFMVFEYLSHDLTGLLNHPSFKLDPAQKKHLAQQMFRGLDYLHQRGVLHRDLKAANILVSKEGILKLADFGLARFYAKRHQLDYTNRVITIWYRPPELLLGETQYGPSCDIWSTGCIMMEIFTRSAIFPGDGGEINQLDRIFNVIGTPNKAEWPRLVDMPWFELLRPSYRRGSTFAAKFQERLSPAAYDLMCSIFKYDPTKRPSAASALDHAYFTTEQPQPRQAVELASLDGEWHELESKAHRRENDRKDREARNAARREAREDRKRESETHDQRGDAKRIQRGLTTGRGA